MCGIAGFWRRSQPTPGDFERLAKMAECLRHRGPDDYGYLSANARTGEASCGQSVSVDFSPDVLLASRRLAIIDLSPDGRQPMTNEAGDIFVVFNGAIHNYKELKQELEAMGHRFRSHTDTEVIVHAYEAWGEECSNRFNGMWAYAIWDGPKRRLVCSRDRFGIKPLYVAYRAGTFYFGSEVKAIIAAGVQAALDPAPVATYLVEGRLHPASETLFSGILPLGAGHNLVVTSTSSEETQYWVYDGHSQNYDHTNPAATFRELFADSVAIRLRSDVPVGILLSGGLDSSAVTAFATKSSDSLTAFTAIFPGFSMNEQRYAQLVADRFGLPLECVEYRPDNLVNDLSAVIWHMETPPLGAQVLARWMLLRTASEHVKVVLEGQGSDEMLAGYLDLYLKPYILDELAGLGPNAALGRLRTLAPALEIAAFAKLQDVGAKSLETVRRQAGGKVRPSILSRQLAGLPSLPGLPSLTPAGPFRDRLTNALWADHRRRILPHLLGYGDSISMAHSVESRVPFLDHRLVEFVFGLPFTWKMQGRETKTILRRALRTDIPRQVFDRRTKVGFDTPLREWLAAGFHQSIRPVIESQRSLERGLFDSDAVRRELDDFESDRSHNEKLILRCLSLELWARLFIDGDGLRM